MAFDAYEYFRPGRSHEQAEAMERLDNGDRDAWTAVRRAMAIAKEQPEPIDPQVAKRTGSDLLDIRAALLVIAKRIPPEGNKDIHLRLNGLVNEVQDLGTVLSERWVS